MSTPIRVVARNRWALTSVFLSCFVMFAVSIIWSNHVAADSYNRSLAATRAAQTAQTKANGQLCALVATFDDTYKLTPPSTETGREVAMEMHNLRLALGC